MTRGSGAERRPRPAKTPAGSHEPALAEVVPLQPPATAPSLPTLAEVLMIVGSDLLETAVAPRGTTHGIGGVAVFDERDAQHVDVERILLGVGVDPMAPAAVSFVRDRAAGSTVVLRGEMPLPDRLVAAARHGGVTLLAAAADLEWGALHSLLTGATHALRRPEAPRAPALAVGDLFALADAIAAVVGGPTTIEDSQHRILAYSGEDEHTDDARREAIIGRQVPDKWLQRLADSGVLAHLRRSDSVLRVELDVEGFQPRLAVAVRADGTQLGSIWVAQGARPLDEAAEGALREAADVAAVHLLRRQLVDDHHRRRRGAELRAVLTNDASAEALAQTCGLSLAGRSSFTVLAFAFPTSDDARGLMVTDRVADLIAMSCEVYARHAVATAVNGTVYALLPTSRPTSRERLVRLASDIIDQAAASYGVRMSAAVGGTVDRLARITVSRREADMALAAAQEFSLGPVADVEALRGHALLLRVAEVIRDSPELWSQKLAVLRTYDKDHKASYVETLRAYLTCQGDISRAADLVHIHDNTFRYRLQRLRALSGIELDDPRERLALMLELDFADPEALAP